MFPSSSAAGRSGTTVQICICTYTQDGTDPIPFLHSLRERLLHRREDVGNKTTLLPIEHSHENCIDRCLGRLERNTDVIERQQSYQESKKETRLGNSDASASSASEHYGFRSHLPRISVTPRKMKRKSVASPVSPISTIFFLIASIYTTVSGLDSRQGICKQMSCFHFPFARQSKEYATIGHDFQTTEKRANLSFRGYSWSMQTNKTSQYKLVGLKWELSTVLYVCPLLRR